MDEPRPEGEVLAKLADVQRALAAQGAPPDVLTSGDWITVREIVSRKPRRKRPMKRLPNALELDRGPALKPMVTGYWR
jgi:hypothetical protein